MLRATTQAAHVEIRGFRTFQWLGFGVLGSARWADALDASANGIGRLSKEIIN